MKNMSMSTEIKQRAIIKVKAKGGRKVAVNYSRRMYAVLRRYTPEVAESGVNECFAELTGLRTFFKMSYKEMTDSVLRDLRAEIGVDFVASTATVKEFDSLSKTSRKSKSVSTYEEINTLFAGASYVSVINRKKTIIKRKIKLTVPFLGKVS